MSIARRSSAEFVGTFWLVFGGFGSAVLSAAIPQLAIGFLGVALAFGLTVLTMCYAIGHISGRHLNPAVLLPQQEFSTPGWRRSSPSTAGLVSRWEFPSRSSVVRAAAPRKERWKNLAPLFRLRKAQPPAAAVAALRKARRSADSGCVNSSQTQTRGNAVNAAASFAGLSSTELAELVALERLARGTVHTLHNAFTTVLGEASFLEDKCKGDSELEETCQVIRSEINRCARLTRALVARRSASATPSTEAPDLARIVRDTSGLLTATLSSRLALRVETPEQLLLVRGCASAIELMVILMVHQAAACAAASAELRLSAIDGQASGRHGLSIELHSPDLAPETAQASPPSVDDRSVALPALALQHLAREQGAELDARRTAYGLSLRLSLPALLGDAGDTG